jgi:hypothetical protein
MMLDLKPLESLQMYFPSPLNELPKFFESCLQEFEAIIK